MSLALILAQTILPLPNDIPSGSVKHVSVHGIPYIVYPSGDGIAILDSSMELVCTLPFSLGFHGVGKGGREGEIGGLAVDQEHALIVASLDSYVVVFAPVLSSFPDPSKPPRRSRAQLRPSWKVHSTMTSPREGPITALDYHKGKLLIACKGSGALWTSDMEDGMGLWSRAWEDTQGIRSSTVDCVLFSPSGAFVAVLSSLSKVVQMIKIDKRGEREGARRSQLVKFARPIRRIWWRSSPKDTTPLLYTLTGTSTVHLHSPVLDDPSFFQLQATISPPISSTPCSSLFPLCASELKKGVEAALASGTGQDSGRRKMLQDIGGDGATLGDLFVGIERDGGGIRIWSVVNVESRPPALLKVLDLVHHPTSLLGSVAGPPISSDSSYTLIALPTPSTQTNGVPSSSTIPPPTAPSLLLLSHTRSRPLHPLHLSPAALFDPSPSHSAKTQAALTSLPNLKDPRLGLTQRVREFFRTPNGRGVISLGEDGECVAWGLDAFRSTKGKGRDGVWRARARWQAEEGVELMALFARGRSIATYVPSKSTVSISYLRPSAGSSLLQISFPMTLPGLSPEHHLTTLVALSDVDDGVSTLTTLPTTSYLIASTSTGWVYLWRLDAGDPTRRGEKEGEPTPTLVSTYLLPYRSGPDDLAEPAFVMSVDPMGWHQSVINWKDRIPLQDMLVVVKQDGELSYWSPRLDEDGSSRAPGREPWVRTGVVKTAKKDVTLARCSSRKKTAMVTSTPDGNELSIWDSKSSEFYSGMEFTQTYSSAESVVNDLDWTTTADLQSVLAVGFQTHVILLAEQRMSYVEEDGSYWDTVLKVEIASLTPNPITDSIWLANGSFAVAAGNQVFIHSRFLTRSTDGASVAPRDVFEMVALGNGPVVDYHPQLLVQCMLWNKIELVKSIVTRLHLAIEGALNRGEDEIDWPRMDVSDFFGAQTPKTRNTSMLNGAAHSRYTSLFDDDPEPDVDEGNGFTRSLVANLIEHLEGTYPLPLSRHERAHLITLVQTLLEIDEQQRALDVNGLRYLISLRFYVIWQQRLPPSGVLTPASGEGGPVYSHHHKERLSFRNVVWALHSQSQDILLTAATQASGGKLMLRNAKALGVFLWLRSTEVLRSQVEVVARNQYMQGDDRDPASCSLLYFALGKVKLVHGLWKQAAWHPEQKVMLKFLANDFSEPRWRTAALKNAFALLSKQRHEYAAAFFLLGGSIKDAVNVCLKQLNDWQLAVAVARVAEGDDGPVLRSILQNTVVPLAFQGGHRWLGTWAFWMLKRRDLAVRILVTPLKDLQPSVDFGVPSVGDSHDDDPSLALLFSQLRSLTLQTAKGTSEIPERTEFNFVLHNARVFTRMGCHVLALDLIRSWTFLRPDVLPKSLPPTAPATPFTSSDDDEEAVAPLRPPSLQSERPGAGGSLRRPSFLLGGGRRQSILIDMDLPASMPPTRTTSPVPPVARGVTGPGSVVEDKKEDEKKAAEDAKKAPDAPVLDQAAIARAKGLGSLMKSAKEDAKQGAAEFDMSAFGF